MPVTHLLIDLENVQPDTEHVRHWAEESGPVWVFHGANQKKLLPPLQAIGDRVTAVPTSRPGKNALDFHLIFYLGYLASRNGQSRFVVLSKDKGYDPAIEHARMLDVRVTRRASLGKAPLPNPPRKVPAKQKAAPAGAKLLLAHTAAATRPTASEPKDPKSKIIEYLVSHPKNRPARRATLERHIGSMVGGTVAPETASALVDELERDGVVTILAKKIMYNLPAAKN